MDVVFIHGPAASGKFTIASRLRALTGLPLFHNHLAVDAAKALFEFGTPGFCALRSTIWRAAFAEAAAAGRSFIFTFHPEASVDPRLIDHLVESVRSAGGRVYFVELICSDAEILRRLEEPSRRQFGKLTDPRLYRTIQARGGLAFPPLPAPLVSIDTEATTPDDAAAKIAAALADARRSR